MSLAVPADLLTAARAGRVSDDAFVACVRDSLPYAYEVVERVARERSASGKAFADNEIPPPDEAARGQLLRALSSNAIRGALERHFGVTLAFQNCHRVAAFAAGAEATEVYRAFVSVEGQLLNQSPELVNC